MQPTADPSAANRHLFRSAGTVMAALVVSQMVGLAAKSLIGATFGTGDESEAFFAANRFAEILFNLVAGGALASAFVPAFTGLLAKEQRPAAWRLASAIANLITIILVIAALLSAVFAGPVVRYILAPGFASDPVKADLTALLLRIQLPSAVIFGLSGLIMGILNAHRHFLLPALAPAMYQFGLIIGVTLLVPLFGVQGLAWGVVLGAGLHLLVQLPMLRRLPQLRYELTLGLKNPDVGEVARLMGPRLLGVAVVQLNFLVNTLLASYQTVGSLAGITLAFPLMIMPQAAIAQSIATASLPTFSAQAALGKLDEMRASLAATLRGVLLLAIPAALGLILLRNPIVALIYQRRAFTPESILLVSWPLLWYAAGLVGHSVLEIVSRAFYALHDTRTPVLVGVIAMTLNLVFSLAFTAIFGWIGWLPNGGLALANSLATLLESLVLLVIMRRRLNGLDGARTWRLILRSGLAAAGMGLVIWGWLSVTGQSPVWLVALGGVVLGGMTYLVLLVVLGVGDIKTIAGIIRSRLVRSGS